MREIHSGGIICRKFGKDRDGWCSREDKGAFGTSVLKEIRKERYTTISHTIFSKWNGRRLRFWKDVWCGDKALCFSSPSVLFGCQ